MTAGGAHRIVELVSQRVRTHPRDPLPSIAALAQEYGVAYPTVWKALHILAGRGVVVCRKGARTMPAGAAKALSSRDRLIDIMRRSILSAAWKAGSPACARSSTADRWER